METSGGGWDLSQLMGNPWKGVASLDNSASPLPSPGKEKISAILFPGKQKQAKEENRVELNSICYFESENPGLFL